MVVVVVRDSDFKTRETSSFILIPSDRVVSRLMLAFLIITAYLQGIRNHSYISFVPSRCPS